MKFETSPSLPSCVLFDFDGTMYRFDDVYPNVWRRFYDRHRAGITEPDFWKVYDAIGEMLGRIPAELDAHGYRDYLFGLIRQEWPEVETPVEMLIPAYEADVLASMKPREGLDDLLVELDRRGIPWGIVSNHDTINRRKLEAMCLRSKPASFMLSMEVGVWKPDVRIFEMAFDEIGNVDPATAVMIGDTVDADIAGGKAAGMRTVLMCEEPQLMKDGGGADTVVSSIPELHTYLFGVQISPSGPGPTAPLRRSAGPGSQPLG